MHLAGRSRGEEERRLQRVGPSGHQRVRGTRQIAQHGVGTKAPHSKGQDRLAGRTGSLKNWSSTYESDKDTDKGPVGHSRSYLVFYDQTALVRSYQPYHSGTPVLDKGAADHTHRAPNQEPVGGCSVL